MSNQDFNSPEYEAYLRELEERIERECGVDVNIGPAHDPYGATCDLDKGHEEDHSAPCPFGTDTRFTWKGGGTCAGDALPFRATRR